MHSETYSVTLAPRDKKSSLSSSEEKSLENVWIARKWKWKRRKNRARLCIFYIFIYLSPVGLHDSILLLQWMQGNIYRDVFPTFLANKSYDWWITRRKWKFIQKYLKEKISRGVGKTEEISHHAWAAVRNSWCCVNFAQPEGVVRISRCCANFAQAWSSCIPKAISSSFQLQIIHDLKRWILDFLSFEMVYSM